ncbi:hypothetical protein PT2222_20069 [Paraburkholderia tropica]
MRVRRAFRQASRALFAARLAVVRADGALGPVGPAIVAGGLMLGVERIVKAVFGLGGFADHHQPHFLARVVQEGMANARARRKAHRIAGREPMQMTVDPRIGRAFEHVHELFFGAFRMRIRRTPTRQQPHMMNADAREPERAGQRRADAHEFGVAAVMAVVRPFKLGPVPDKRGALHDGAPREENPRMTPSTCGGVHRFKKCGNKRQTIAREFPVLAARIAFRMRETRR